MNGNKQLRKCYPKLKDFLCIDFRGNLCIRNPISVLSDIGTKSLLPPRLKYYFEDKYTSDVIKHNIRWAKGNEKKPKFQFVYVMLPNKCNQKCLGCFTGQDKEKLPEQFNGRMYSEVTLETIFSFLKEHGVKTIIYGGGGELFFWEKAFDYIKKVYDYGFRMVIFTNGTLLTKKQIEKLNSYDVSLVVSLRDTIEDIHNKHVGFKGFSKTLKTIDYALQENMQKNNRLAIEIPVTKINQDRIVKHLLPTLRSLNIVPLIEEFIPIPNALALKGQLHTFNDSREFFLKAQAIDRSLGFLWDVEYGQRMLSQPKCRRVLYSFAICPSGDVIDCPCDGKTKYGNLYSRSLQEIIYSVKLKKRLVSFDYCACSVFYTKNYEEVKRYLPNQLEDL